ncbi:hypothetical protein NEDG_01038 [Nematocida displodere]|uniref:Uncharacterized protein n=1 Tax=Nematocida displodere TaxID=1805483 RepID=A0A177ED26_9MICR|nr:hypothetical protein NEDG_01038 [Nematocida displodere]
MERNIKLMHQLLRDRVPFNVVTIEDEKQIRKAFNIPQPEVSFNPAYDHTRVNLVLKISKAQTKELLKERKGLFDTMLKNEHAIFSEIAVLSENKELLPPYDDLSLLTPAEQKAVEGDTSVPGYLLRENLKSQGKLPVSRAVRITGKYTDEVASDPGEE